MNPQTIIYGFVDNYYFTYIRSYDLRSIILCVGSVQWERIH